MSRRIGLGIWLLAVVATVGCGGGDNGGTAEKPGNSSEGGTPVVKSEGMDKLSGEIIIDGSSSVGPLTSAMAEEFNAEAPNVKITVGQTGTGAGFKRFVRGETDISDASRPIQKGKDGADGEMELAKKGGVEYIEIPVAYDAICVVVSKKNEWLNEISVADLHKMWAPEAEKTITKWKQVNDAWPDEEFRLFGAGTDSGTFDYFTEAINKKAKSGRADYTPSENDNTLVQGTADDKNALAYVPFSYYEGNKDRLKALKIDNGAGPIEPSAETIASGAYAPLSRPIFIYAKKASLESKPEVKRFIEFYLANAGKIAAEEGFFPLDPAIYAQIGERVKGLQVGTSFGGEQKIGTPLAKVLETPPQP